MGLRWKSLVGPALVSVGALAVVGWSMPSGQHGAWLPSGCPDTADGSVAAAVGDDLATGTWFRVDPVLDDAGSLVGQRLVVAIEDRTAETAVDLPPESFAAGPFGRLILMGTDDGTTSRLQTLDLRTGCLTPVAQASAVIRRATVSPDGSRIYESRVDRMTRSDLGIWERPLAGESPAMRVVGAIDPDERFGRTWSTDFAWSVDGDRLAIQSCGASACRTRVLEPVGGRVRIVDDPTLGPLVGLAGDRLVTYEACRGLPCPLISTDLVSLHRDVLTPTSGDAVLVGRGASTRVIHETFDGAERRLRRVDPTGSAAHDLGPLGDGLRLASGAPGATAEGRAPVGSIRLVPDGVDPVGPWPPETTLRRIADGSTVRLEDLTR